jgi:hypothetical protein
MSLEAAMLGASQPRNEKLASLFYRMKLIEAYGIARVFSPCEIVKIAEKSVWHGRHFDHAAQCNASTVSSA